MCVGATFEVERPFRHHRRVHLGTLQTLCFVSVLGAEDPLVLEKNPPASRLQAK